MIENIIWFVVSLLVLGVIFFFTYALYVLLTTGIPFINTNRKIIDQMIEMVGDHTPTKIADLGCGSGEILFVAGQKFPKAQIIGFEILKPIVWLANWRNQIWHKNPHLQFVAGDFFQQKSDYTDADVFFLYLFPGMMEQIETEIVPHLKPGTILIAHAFQFKNLEPTQVIDLGAKKLRKYVV